jgi:SHS2 domain-containing protein
MAPPLVAADKREFEAASGYSFVHIDKPLLDIRLVRSELEAVGVKAATYHRLRLERGSGGWTADVYLDV